MYSTDDEITAFRKSLCLFLLFRKVVLVSILNLFMAKSFKKRYK